MATYVDIFGGSPVQPAELQYSRLTLSAANDGSTLAWPWLNLPDEQPVARVLEVTSDQAGRTFRMPPATEVGSGQDVLIVNVGAFQVLANKNDGSSLVTMNAGDAKYCYLTDASTAAGLWGVVSFGASVSFADASALTGVGTLAVLGKLVTAMPSQLVDATFAATSADRAKTYVFTGGTQTLTLPSAASMGAEFFLGARNSGTGTISVVRTGTDTIDGQTTLQMNPDESALFFSNGANWFTMGRGRSATFNFTQLIKSVAGGVNVTLTSAETQNKLITFTGLLTANIQVIFPTTVNVYYLFNNTTGAFTLTVKTAAGSGFVIPQGQRIIAFCDGNDMFSAQTAVPGSAILFADGTQAAPSITFASDIDLGFYRFGSNEMGAVSNNVLGWRLNDTRLLMGLPINFVNTTVRDQTVTALGISPVDDLNLAMAIQGGL